MRPRGPRKRTPTPTPRCGVQSPAAVCRIAAFVRFVENCVKCKIGLVTQVFFLFGSAPSGSLASAASVIRPLSRRQFLVQVSMGASFAVGFLGRILPDEAVRNQGRQKPAHAFVTCVAGSYS